MSEAIKLTARPRQSVSDLKEMIPAVMYGSGIDNTSLSVKRLEFEQVFTKSGESGLISLTIDGQDYPVIVKDFQVDPVRQRIIHIDFFKLNMNEKVVAEVNLEFVGESPAVKAHGGIVVHNFNSLEIECLPKDLVQKVEVDLSPLVEIGDAIHVSDIVLPAGIIFKNDSTDMVVHVIEPKKVVEEAAPVADSQATTADGEAKTDEKSEVKDEKKEEKK